MASTVVALCEPPCSNFRTALAETPAARARSVMLHPRGVRATQHCTGTIGTMVATPAFGQVCHVARFAYSTCGFETVPLRSNGSQSGASVTHRPHIRNRSRSSFDVASSQNCSISPTGTPARRMALITRSMTRKSSPAASIAAGRSPSSLTNVALRPQYGWRGEGARPSRVILSYRRLCRVQRLSAPTWARDLDVLAFLLLDGKFAIEAGSFSATSGAG
jgi:hypothetical protein